MPMDQGIGSIYKKKYCEGNYEFCARYKVFAEFGKNDVIPDYLYPNMDDIADKIISEEKKKR